MCCVKHCTVVCAGLRGLPLSSGWDWAVTPREGYVDCMIHISWRVRLVQSWFSLDARDRSADGMVRLVVVIGI